jgi:histidyl-tRNA synthetase
VLEPRFAAVADEIRAALGDWSDTQVVSGPDRSTGRAYYTGLCFKVVVTVAAEPFEIADGGFVDWTQQLLGNRKERLLTSGIGVDRLALA